ncbi:class I mannose-6-phosphate isomerase [Paenibacillus sp. 1P07SE]|uniref:class I mannose-6-phosphate isomerase n=1 Tax=Paenibacillus sp. 1P07SE TaxID=3132209 RepID=UPI0039A49421
MHPGTPVQLMRNRVWRTYKGGQVLSQWYNEAMAADTHYPEEWVASTVAARQGASATGEHEGQCRFEGPDGRPVLLTDWIHTHAEAVLGTRHLARYGTDTGVLVKLLDAAERLAIQVHPSSEKAQMLFGSPYGKTEAWYVLEGREVGGEPPHIFAGFKPGTTRDKIVTAFHKQDISGMLDCLHKIPVTPGEVYLIRGGLPHAIGPGCLLLEIQEATDYTIRIERTSPSGFKIEDELCHQGLGFERMFDCFGWETRDAADTLRHIRLQDSEIQEAGEHGLISYDDTPCFALSKINVLPRHQHRLADAPSFSVLVVTEGSGTLRWENQALSLQRGAKVFLPASCSGVTVEGEAGLLALLRCYPPQA